MREVYTWQWKDDFDMIKDTCLDIWNPASYEKQVEKAQAVWLSNWVTLYTIVTLPFIFAVVGVIICLLN